MLAFEIKQSCPRREREGPIFLSPKWLDKVPQTFDRSNHKKSLALAVGAWSFSKKKKKYRRPSGGKHKQKLKKKAQKKTKKKKRTWSILTFASWLTVIFMHSFFFCFLAALCMEICPSSFVLFSCYYNSLRIPPFISPWLLVFRQVTRTHIKFAYYWGGQPIRQSGSSSFPKRLFIFFLFCISLQGRRANGAIVRNANS